VTREFSNLGGALHLTILAWYHITASRNASYPVLSLRLVTGRESSYHQPSSENKPSTTSNHCYHTGKRSPLTGRADEEYGAMTDSHSLKGMKGVTQHDRHGIDDRTTIG